ncbi:hypothetical protein, partial [Klebsiella aerogenes]|uniref:hypothetical protein n=1 Tax=Klebsiella aerogenes TaxID=548 RepID=UPI001952EDD9
YSQSSIALAMGSGVNSYFPIDHTHTSPAGAEVVAEAVLKAVACTGTSLKSVLTTTSFEGLE